MNMNQFAISLALLFVSGPLFASSISLNDADYHSGYEHAGHHDFDFYESGNGPEKNYSDHDKRFEWDHDKREHGSDLYEASDPGKYPWKRGDFDHEQEYFHAGNMGHFDARYCEINQPPAVPLPAAGWLFISGLIGIIAVSRQKRPHKY